MVESVILKNCIALDYDFQPKQLPFREKQYKQIIKIINSFEYGKKENILVYGSSDTEKLHAVKSVLNDYDEKLDHFLTFYINCLSKNNLSSIIMEMCDILDYKKVRNMQINELFGIIKKSLQGRNTLFIFDGIENLRDFQILEMICKEVDKKLIILITDNKQFFDNNIKSMLKVKNVEFKPYNLKEIKGVFKQRIDFALYPNVLDSDAFDLITKKSFEIGSLKVGLSILRKACIEAEMKGLDKITKLDIQRAINNDNTILCDVIKRRV